MNITIFIGYFLICFYIMLILLIAAFLKQKYANNTSRKIVHIGVAFSWFIMYIYFSNTIHLLFVPVVTLLINLISNKLNVFSFIPLLNDNRDQGTYLYPLSMLIMSIITIIIPDFYPAYGIGLFSMALGDGFASIVGMTFETKKIEIKGSIKSFAGCLTVFIITTIIAYFIPYFSNIPISLLHAMVIGATGMFLEIFGGKNSDNITLPLGVSFLAYLVMR